MNIKLNVDQKTLKEKKRLGNIRYFVLWLLFAEERILHKNNDWTIKLNILSALLIHFFNCDLNLFEEVFWQLKIWMSNLVIWNCFGRTVLVISVAQRIMASAIPTIGQFLLAFQMHFHFYLMPFHAWHCECLHKCNYIMRWEVRQKHKESLAAAGKIAWFHRWSCLLCIVCASKCIYLILMTLKFSWKMDPAVSRFFF